ncbi:ABC transporter ATP-binding protein/permease [Streptomyces sp. NBC_01433]|uniref:ABC transporter transmembrane domain-containing protein n=1 Tax=Streptomyces sp. NBC_01433 TaxID=2903864 RepID=UPI00225B95B3|nr:ABC transporter ATP-binding protein [Streptomyces sp. NBC_01433]MCX4676428.1 ABC transporter ATP-binding protein/permease [Streptomyces sp. NBC_01433]
MSSDVSRKPLGHLVRDLSLSERRPIALFAALALAGAVAEATVPLLVGASLSAALDAGTGQLAATVLGLGAALAVGIITNVTRNAIASRIKVRNAARLRTSIGEKAARAPREVAASAHQAQVATVVSYDVERVTGFPIARIKLVASIIGMAVVSAYLLWISPWVTLLILVGVPTFMWLTTKIAEPLEERQERHRELLGKVTELSSDIALGLRILRGLGAQNVMRARFEKASLDTEQAGVRVARTEALLFVSGNLLPGILLTGVVTLGGHLAASGAIAATDLVTFYAASAYLVLPVSTAAGYSGLRSSARVAAKNIVDILEIPESEWPGRLSPIPTDADLFDQVTGLRVPAGKFSVLVPDGGIDSEALCRRLAGLTSSADEPVLLGGRPLRDYDLPALRDAVRYHGSRTTILSGSAHQVLDPTARHGHEDLRPALWAAGATDVIDRLPEGLHTHIDADGRSVSGGQRQRLVLARSLLGDPSILVLVEPTTALDAVTEVEVARRIAQHRHGRTTLVVSRSGAFRAVADQVLRIQGGTCV